MPLTCAATDVFGILTIVLVVLCCGAGALCSIYVILFHCKVGEDCLRPLRDFISPWVVRVVLICFSVLWSLGELLRLPWLRETNGALHSLDWKFQANFCRVHVVWSLGIMEPGFFLTVLFLVRGAALSAARRNLNGRVLMLMGLFCLPIFITQLLLAATSHSGNQREFSESIPSYFTKPFDVVLDDGNTQWALCTYPLFSVLLLGLFSSIFIFYFSRLGMKMLHHVINRKLQMRVCWLVLAVMVLLPMHVLFLGFSVRMKPSETTHEALMFLGFLTLLLCATGGMGVLVLLPIADALAVHRFFKRRWQSSNTSPIEPFGQSISAAVSDNDESPYCVARLSLLGTVSSTGTDVGTPCRDATLTFDTMPKNVTLKPGGWLVDV